MNRPMLLLIFTFLCGLLSAQVNRTDASVTMELKETAWLFDAIIYAETKEVIYQSEEENLTIFFKYDSTAQQRFNDEVTVGRWEVKDGFLNYAIKGANQFEVAYLDGFKLGLKFEQNGASFLYSFTRKEIPKGFKTGQASLAPLTANQKHEWKWPKALEAKRNEYFSVEKDTTNEIIIELTGGGYYGGIDPVYRDFIRIMPSGKLLFEFKSKERGYIKRFKKIDRDQLQTIVDFATKKGFFNLPQAFDCTSAICTRRKKMEPKPRPLNLFIKHGVNRKLLTIAIYGEDRYKYKYVDYPAFVDELIKAVRDLAHN